MLAIKAILLLIVIEKKEHGNVSRQDTTVSPENDLSEISSFLNKLIQSSMLDKFTQFCR